VKYFSSSIAGKKLVDFQQQDYSVEKFGDRLEVINEVIGDGEGNVHEFFSTYFGEYYDVSPTQQGWMAEQDAVCRTLEMLGTYLLNAKDIDTNRKIQYRFWKSEREFKQYKESENVVASAFETGEGSSEVEVFDMFYSNEDKNQKIVKGMNILSKDIREIVEIGRLQDLVEKAGDDSFVKMIENRIDASLPIIMDEEARARLLKIRKNVKGYVTRWIREAKDNQIAIKKAIKRPIEFKNLLKDEGVANKLDAIDFSDIVNNKELLRMLNREDMMDEDGLGLIIYDYNRMLDRMILTVREQSIVDSFRQGYAQEELEELLGIKKNTVSETITRIAKKSAKFYVKELYKIAIKNK